MSDLAQRIIAEAMTWIGTPFVHRGSVKGSGADCLGLIRGVWRGVHGDEPWVLPPYGPMDDQTEHLGNILSQYLPVRQGAVQAGDVILFRLHARQAPRHLGIALPEGRFIHATAPMGVVAVHLAGPWQRRICSSFVLAPMGKALALKG